MATITSNTCYVESWISLQIRVTYSINGGTVHISSIEGHHTASSGNVWDATRDLTHSISYSGGSSSFTTYSGSSSSGHGCGFSTGWWSWDIGGGFDISPSGSGTISITTSSATSVGQMRGKTFTFNDPIDVKDPAPTNVSINPVGDSRTSINLNRSWQGATYCQYNIADWGWINEYNSYPNGVHVDGNAVTGLQPNTTYSCRIRMGNNNSDLTYSDTKYATTLCNKPSSLSLSVNTNKWLKANGFYVGGTVSATGDTNAPITKYVLHYKKSSASSYTDQDIGTSTSWTIKNLAENTTYNLYFTATNAGGSTDSGSTTFTTANAHIVSLSVNGGTFKKRHMYVSINGDDFFLINNKNYKIKTFK